MRVSKRQRRRIIREEKRKIILESVWLNDDIQAMAEEAGIYYKDMWDVPSAAEGAVEAGLIDLALIDAAAEELADAGAMTPEDVLDPGFSWHRAISAGHMGALQSLIGAIKEYRGEQGRRFPINPNAPKSSYLPMMIWVLAK